MREKIVNKTLCQPLPQIKPFTLASISEGRLSIKVIKFNNDYLHLVNFLTRRVRFLHHGYPALGAEAIILSASLLKGKDCM
jgi:hypothetical protein